MNNPGKYDEACTMVRLLTNAGGVIVIVFDGTQGSGFSVQGPPSLIVQLPELLRRCADGIESQRDPGQQVR